MRKRSVAEEDGLRFNSQVEQVSSEDIFLRNIYDDASV